MAKNRKLFDDEDSEDNDAPQAKEVISVNESYARKYDRWRRAEELQKLKDRYGSNAELEDGDSSSSSSSDGEYVDPDNPDFDEEFYNTLSALKGDKKQLEEREFFKDAFTGKKHKEKCSKEKPMTLKDYEKKIILGGVEEDDENDAKGGEPRQGGDMATRGVKVTKKFIGFEDDDLSENDDDGLLVKTKVEEPLPEKEKETYQPSPKKLKLSPSIKPETVFDKLWKSSKEVTRQDKWLKDFFVNKRYLEEESGEQSGKSFIIDEESISDDEATLHRMELFETKYNHRFEEPNSDVIRRYPRNIQDTVRTKDEKRKQKRDCASERKKAEKERVKQEILQMRALQKQEILDKIERIKEISGSEKLDLMDEDLEDDFDPDAHDAKMREMFDSEYYGCGDAEEEKPVFSDDEDLYNDYDHWLEKQNTGSIGTDDNKNKHAEKYNAGEECADIDPEFNMDADFDPSQPQTSKSSKKRKRRKQPKLAEVLSSAKPAFNPEETTFDDYLDEYYKLDFEDIVAGMPVRFNYRNVEPNSFGLSTEEILSSKDAELNKWFSLKKLLRYDRTEIQERRDAQNYAKRAQQTNIKYRCLPSLFLEDPEEALEAEKEKKRKKNLKNKLRKQKKQFLMETEEVPEDQEATAPENVCSESKKSDVLFGSAKEDQKPTDKSLITDKEECNSKSKTQRSFNSFDGGSSSSPSYPEEKGKSRKTGTFNETFTSHSDADIESELSVSRAEISKKRKKKKKRLNASAVEDSAGCTIGSAEEDSTSLHEKGDKTSKEMGRDRDLHKEHYASGEGQLMSRDFEKDRPVTAKSKKVSKVKETNEKINQSTFNKKERKLKSKKNNVHNIGRKNNENTAKKDDLSGITDERLAAYGINPKKLKRKLKYKIVDNEH